ncbi:hypothetical protein [Ekhidna sp.]|uniref:hypothetical protein n=1 Tax=Ekhidna sp. TaxID=2608089 RepID=UPI003CCB7F46
MKFFVYFLFLFSTMVSMAQEDYLITLKGDTIKGDIDIYQSTFYDEVQLKNDNGKTTFKAYQVKLVRMDDQAYEPIAYSNRKVMAQVVTKGSLSLYLTRQEKEINFETRVLYKDDEALEIGNIGFRNILTEYLNDCPILTRQLENKEINPNELDYIVTTYNTKCANDSVDKTTTTDFSELKELSQLLADIITRIDQNEEVPSYMINALKQYSEISTDSKIQSLIDFLDNK